MPAIARFSRFTGITRFSNFEIRRRNQPSCFFYLRAITLVFYEQNFTSQHEYFIFEINDHAQTQLNVLFLLDINEKPSKSLFAVIKNNVAMVLYITERRY